MKRYIIATRDYGYCGGVETEYYIFPEGTTDKEIDKYNEEDMYDYAEDYEDEQEYYDNRHFNWRDASENEIRDYEKKWLSI